ncbi:hypothetical protein BT96DRAFT_829877 [Gymnopus androsaceus JB14]|uniref:Uncharacterized protein n=1 Tax=Gymnopus androsaceus JB14 TaxID=1447944 RepID=A0A6A4H6L4_9AGAR|nr:hypothetical protein BT96DRAFT_829877 [Gymnopus androsaceus JB14]
MPPFVSDISTLHRHLGLKHEYAYQQWAKANDFKSMIPKDVADRKNAEATAIGEQGTINDHAVPLEPKPRIIPYSDELFQQAAIEWLVETDQPIAALEHPKFRNMINVAARATNGIKIPGCKAT